MMNIIPPIYTDGRVRYDFADVRTYFHIKKLISQDLGFLGEERLEQFYRLSRVNCEGVAVDRNINENGLEEVTFSFGKPEMLKAQKRVIILRMKNGS